MALSRTLEVQIPRGIGDGQVIRVQGEGEPPAPERSADGSGIKGDLHVVVRILPHDLFERDGDQIIWVQPMAFAQAALSAVVGEHPGAVLASFFGVKPIVQTWLMLKDTPRLPHQTLDHELAKAWSDVVDLT